MNSKILKACQKTGYSAAISFCMIICFPEIGFSQLKSLDGLKKQLENHRQEDTVKVNLLNELSYQDQWSNFYQSLKYAEKALQIAEQLSYQKGIATAKYRIAHCYWALGESHLSIDQALQAATIAAKMNSPAIAGESFRILGINYRDQQDYMKAETYMRKAEQAAILSGSWDLMSRVYNTWGVLAYTHNNNDLALARYNKALSIVETHPTFRFHLSQVYSNIGEMYAPDRKNNPKLESYFFGKALTVARTTRNRSAEAAILNSIAKVLIRNNRFSEADQYLNQSLALASELHVKRIIKNILLSFIDLKIRQGRSLEAQKYVEKYYEVRDSLLNEKKTHQIIEMETRFDTEKKEQMIRFLEQEKQIQTIWKNIWIIGSALLLAAIVMIYRLQQLRARKATQMLDVQTALTNQLKETDELKSRFFANISHEFRTPLSLILAPVEEMARSSSMPVSHKNSLRMVRRNANRLLDLVNQLLDLSKIDAGKMKLQMRGAGLQDFLIVLAASFDSFAETRLIRFNRSIKVPAGEAWFDKDKLEKIISNILSNAFNFTDADGTVTFSVTAVNNDEDILIEVTDTGKGIPPEELAHVFSPFYQTRRTADDSRPGTGIGLTLVAELVKLHQGKIELKSEVDKGTTISITLPVKKEKLDFEEVIQVSTLKSANPEADFNDYITTETEASLSSGSGCILVVEDNPDLRNFIASCFESDFKIIQACDGEEGLKLAIEKVPDLIISDVMMPKMDGNLLTEKIKTDDRTSHIPVILLTAKTDSDSRMDGFRRGADDYLAKPFSTEELRVRVTNLIELRKKLASKYRRNLLTPIEPDQVQSLDDRFMANLGAIIESHLSDPAFGVEQLAEEMCLSRTQLFRKVKGLVDISPIELINDIRLQRAAEMIRCKADSLTQISYAVGYNEQSYFAKRFRRKFGVSPSEYANP